MSIYMPVDFCEYLQFYYKSILNFMLGVSKFEIWAPV